MRGRRSACRRTSASGRCAGRAARRSCFLLLLAAVLVLYALRGSIFPDSADVWVRVATVVLVAVLGWGIARALGRLAAPTFFRRMDPSTAGTVGFIIRLVTVGITLLAALRIARVSPSTLVAGSAFTAVILGLAAQQTLGNLFAGMVLLSARPFRVGERVRLQAGAVGGTVEGIVSSLGLLYTTLARGDDRIQVPNNIVLAAAVVPDQGARARRRPGPAERRDQHDPGAGDPRRSDQDRHPLARGGAAAKRSTATRSWSGYRRPRSGPTTARGSRTRSSPRSRR